jgi:hypothetical protein
MTKYIVKRILLMIPTLVGVAVLIFFLMRVVPGDIVELRFAGEGGAASKETLVIERARLGLDQPLWRQFVDWMWGLARGDLGTPRISVTALALTAVTQIRENDPDGAAATFAAAVSLADERSLYHPLTVIPRTELLQLLESATTITQAPDVAERLGGLAVDGAEDPFVNLSPRERHVLALIIADTRLQDIAAASFVSVNTVKTHLSRARAALRAAWLREAGGGRA